MSAGRRARDPLDRYDTDPRDTARFLDRLVPHLGTVPIEVVLEPAAGAGNMLPPLRAAFPHARLLARDVEPRGEGICRADFLDPRARGGPDGGGRFDPDPDLIFTNPPFRLAEQFLTRAMEVVAEGGFVVLLLRAAFLESRKRSNLLERYPPTDVWFCTTRPRFTGPNAAGGTDSAMYAWFLWEKGTRQTYFRGYVL
ncbi:MAG TPA: hypothetical protein VFC53_04015 [Dehalococcoidia bacterium]|nr:hypothetical protein [Dehalococcoidia bacterium]